MGGHKGGPYIRFVVLNNVVIKKCGNEEIVGATLVVAQKLTKMLRIINIKLKPTKPNVPLSV